MRDVPLPPQRDVLQRRQGVGAHDAGQPGHPLADDRVALVRHRRRTRLAFAKGLFHFAQFGALQRPDLGGDLLERARDHREVGEVLGVAVPLDDLRRHRGRPEAEPGADIRFHLRRRVRVGPDFAGDLADGDHLARAPEAVQAPPDLRVPQGRLEPERDRLGLDAVGAAGHHGAAVPGGQRGERPVQARQLARDQIGGPDHQHRERSIHDIGGPQPAVQVAGVFAGALADDAQKRHDIVARLPLLQILDAGHAPHARALPQPPRRRLGDQPHPRLSLGREQLDLQPRGELRLGAPQRRHLRRGVSRDHAHPSWQKIMSARSGPTPASASGAPTISSMRRRNARASTGRSVRCRAPVVGRRHPGSSS